MLGPKELIDMRTKVLDGTITDDDLRGVIEALRQSRAAASGTAKTAKGKKPSTTRQLSDSEMDSLLEGI